MSKPLKTPKQRRRERRLGEYAAGTDRTADRGRGTLARADRTAARTTATEYGLVRSKNRADAGIYRQIQRVAGAVSGRLEVIDKENRTIITEVLSFKKSLSEFKNEVDTTKFEKLANNTLWEMKTQIRYLKQPPIVLRTIVFLTVLSILTILATGYLYRDRNEWRGEATYWYKQSDQYKTTQTNKK